jgi:hypothetical protein
MFEALLGTRVRKDDSRSGLYGVRFTSRCDNALIFFPIAEISPFADGNFG